MLLTQLWYDCKGLKIPNDKCYRASLILMFLLFYTTILNKIK